MRSDWIQVRGGLPAPSRRRWIELAFVFVPAVVLAAIARRVDPVDRVPTGTGIAWYSQQRELAGWLFAGAFAWLLFSIVILWLRGRRPAPPDT